MKYTTRTSESRADPIYTGLELRCSGSDEYFSLVLCFPFREALFLVVTPSIVLDIVLSKPSLDFPFTSFK
jgi:hypothetical protein